MTHDSIFLIGKTHKICQDYALTGIDSFDHEYAVVSDGCSSSKDTDCGARLVCKTYGGKNGKSVKELIVPFNDIFEKGYLDVTQLSLGKLPDQIMAGMLGDGVVAAKNRDGSLEIYSVAYAGGAPCYFSYYHNPVRFQGWKKEYNTEKTVTKTIIANGVRTSTDTISENIFEEFDFPKEKYEFVAIMSDGVQSFRKAINTSTTKTTEPIDYLDIIGQLLGFKNFGEGFVQRRIHAFLKDNPIYTHSDDFSLAVITQ